MLNFVLLDVGIKLLSVVALLRAGLPDSLAWGPVWALTGLQSALCCVQGRAHIPASAAQGVSQASGSVSGGDCSLL